MKILNRRFMQAMAVSAALDIARNKINWDAVKVKVNDKAIAIIIDLSELFIPPVT